MDSFAAIIDLWPSRDALDQDLRVPSGRAALWRHRNNIPPEYWRDLVLSAFERGLADVTLERLAGLAARRVPPRPSEDASAA